MKPGKKPFLSKICPECGVDKPRSEYYKKAKTVSHKCKVCSLADIHKRSSKYIGKYRDYQNRWRRKRYQNSAAYREKHAKQRKAAYEARKAEINAARRDRWANDPMNPARLYHRRKDVKLCTPRWGSRDEILRIYANCPAGYEVDHAIPIKGLIDGRPISGLHVPDNLQYLTIEQNRKKRNRISESDI